ncbi:hypothetical protein ECEC1856_2749, partial [Escherichia coli EC1856]
MSQYRTENSDDLTLQE